MDENRGGYLRRDLFASERKRLEDRIATLERHEQEHDKEHEEEERWRRRIVWASLILPIVVGIVLMLYTATFLGRSP